MCSTSTGHPIPADVVEELRRLLWYIESEHRGAEVWDRLLSPEERTQLGGDFLACYHQYGTVAMWQKLRGGSVERALIELAQELGQLNDAAARRLLRNVGERPTVPVSQAIPPEERTRPMTYQEAARFLGRKRKPKTNAEWLAAQVNRGIIQCEHITRQTHVFCRRDFPRDVQDRILPR